MEKKILIDLLAYCQGFIAGRNERSFHVNSKSDYECSIIMPNIPYFLWELYELCGVVDKTKSSCSSLFTVQPSQEVEPKWRKRLCHNGSISCVKRLYCIRNDQSINQMVYFKQKQKTVNDHLLVTNRHFFYDYACGGCE